MSNLIEWNNKVKLILADVDETIADVYTDATPEMISSLNSILSNGIVLFMVSGGGLQSIRDRVADKIKPELRHKILIAHCSGAEVWGFDSVGNINNEPYYGLYDEKLNDEQKNKWREVMTAVIKKYHLNIFQTMSKPEFVEKSKGDPLSIMYVDRGPQITLEFVNSVDLDVNTKNQLESKLGINIPSYHDSYDLRVPISEELKKIYKAEKLPVTTKMGGNFALDNPLEGVDKTFAIDYVLKNKIILESLDLPFDVIAKPEMVEIWGDKFNQKKGGPDFLMCKAVDPKTRAIDFRQEDTDGMPEDFNIQIWNGYKRLHEGLLEYLQSVV